MHSHTVTLPNGETATTTTEGTRYALVATLTKRGAARQLRSAQGALRAWQAMQQQGAQVERAAQQLAEAERNAATVAARGWAGKVVSWHTESTSRTALVCYPNDFGDWKLELVQVQTAAEPAKARKASSRQARNDAQVQALLAVGTVTMDTWIAVTGKTAAYYLTASAWTAGEHKGQPATWNPYYMACARLGIAVTRAKVDGVAQLTLSKLAPAEADAQRASLQAGRARYAAAKAARKAAKLAA